jgi:hypothetical protein
MQQPLIKNIHSLKLIMMIMLFGLLSGCIKDVDRPHTANEESADVVHDWYKLIAQIQLRTNPAPVVIQNFRNYGFVGVGLYESVYPGIKGAVSLSTKLYQMPSMPASESNKEYLWAASANAALASMFRQLLVGLTDADRARMDSLENAYNNRFQSSTSDAVFSRSQSFGRSIATAIYNWSTSDNFNLSSAGYTLPVSPSAWVPTPPAGAPPVGPFLMNSRPFLASSLTATTPPMPYGYSEDPNSAFYDAAREVYNVGKTLTAEQKAIANWWADVGGVGAGLAAGAHVLSIVTVILESKNAKLGRASEIYAKTGIALKDAFIIVWRGKYLFNLLRPITYINRHIDPTWQSFLVNPPYPDYPSGLAGVYSSAMQVMIREFGDIPVTDNAYYFRPLAARTFPSITKLVEEACVSRLYGGIHYMFAMDAAVVVGKELGNNIANIELTKTEAKKHY